MGTGLGAKFIPSNAFERQRGNSATAVVINLMQRSRVYLYSTVEPRYKELRYNYETLFTFVYNKVILLVSALYIIFFFFTLIKRDT